MNRAKKELINKLTYEGTDNVKQCKCGDYMIAGWCPSCRTKKCNVCGNKMEKSYYCSDECYKTLQK